METDSKDTKPSSEEDVEMKTQEVAPQVEPSEEDIAKAEELKAEGNEFFKAGKYHDAQQKYSDAVAVGLTGRKQAIYYTNMAFSNIRLENLGLAIMEATNAIKQDKTFFKAYYRRGCAYFLMDKVNEAAKDFKQLCKLCPKDKDARGKYNMAVKEKNSRLFALSIAVEEVKIELSPDDFREDPKYTGPKLEKIEDVTTEWCDELMKFQRDGGQIHSKYLAMLLNWIRDMCAKMDSMVSHELGDDEEITVCGDTHGQYFDLIHIFDINGNPSETNQYLFNGDFVDRGSWSCEVMIAFIAWKIALPNHFHFTRGNHEAKSMNKMYGFEGEITKKFSKVFYEFCGDFFNWIPIAYCLNKDVLVLHGGLFADEGVTLEDIRKVDRHREPPEKGIMCDALWSDPCEMDGKHPSKRGVGIMFGPDVSQKFMEENSLKYLVRSHEAKQNGYEIQKGGKVITIFSAPNYCDQMGNKGAYIKFKGSEMEPKFTTFDAVKHPDIKPMAYASSFNQFQ